MKGQNCAPEGGIGADNGEKLFWKINSCFILFEAVCGVFGLRVFPPRSHEGEFTLSFEANRRKFVEITI